MDLTWTGEYLGTFTSDDIINKWKVDGENYLQLKYKNTHIFGKLYRTNNLLPCIVDELKTLFDIDRRGLVRIIIGQTHYILYKLETNAKGQLIYEVSLNNLDPTEQLQTNINFRTEVQKILLFCELLGLHNTQEPNIKVRKVLVDKFCLINTNDKQTSISKAEIYDYSVLNKSCITKWFGENYEIKDELYKLLKITNEDEINQICFDLRDRIQQIIKKYDENYIWYENFIINRITRNLY